MLPYYFSKLLEEHPSVVSLPFFLEARLLMLSLLADLDGHRLEAAM